jgi:putative ABC transport system permease protein
MKYIPLIWVALRRKPIRTVLTFLSITVVFNLFGLMIGLSATISLMDQRARADRVWIMPRFGFEAAAGLPVSMARQVAAMPGVKNTTLMAYLPGYVGDPKNRAFIAFFDDEYGRIFPEWGPSPAQWEMMRRDRRAIVMSRTMAALHHKKVGDTFTLIAPQVAKADGTRTWTFKIAAIGEEAVQVPGGYIDGNYNYYDQSVPLADQGKTAEIDVLTDDPAQAPALAERIDKLFANSDHPTQSLSEKMIYAPGASFGGMDIKAVTRDISLAGLVMILFLTANVMARSVRERLTEFATLKTFGYSDATLLALVVAEALAPCLLGAVCGVGLSGWLARQLPALMPRGFSLPPPTLSWEVFLLAMGSALVIALASTAIPILRLSRMDIAAALSGRA